VSILLTVIMTERIDIPCFNLFNIISCAQHTPVRFSSTNQLNARIVRAKLRYMRSERKGLR
jgi:hypothetical protein